jgi:protein TonB
METRSHRFVRGLGVLLLAMLGACGTVRMTEGVAVVLPPPSLPEAMLTAALDSPSAEERATAAWQLAGLLEADPDTVERLRRAVDTDPEERVRLAAAWGLGHVRGRPGSPEGPTSLGEQMPKLIQQGKPQYPQDAFDKHIQGVVSVEILIGERGEVTHAEIRKSIPALDAAALSCVRTWKFSPATRNGRAIPVVALAPVSFRIY